MDAVALIRLVSGIAFFALLAFLIVRATRKSKKDSGGEKEVKPRWSSGDRNYMVAGCSVCLLLGVMARWATVDGILFGIGVAVGDAGFAFLISYRAYGRKKNWHKFARLFFWLCLIFAMLPYYPLHSGTK